MRTLTLNSTFGAALVALALAGCPGDSSDETTTDPTNSTPSQTDPTPGTTTTEGTTVENPTSSTNPDDTTGTPPDDTTANPDDTTGTPPDDTTANPDDTTGTPDDTTGTPDDTTGAPDDTTASGGGLSFAADVYGPILMARCSCHVNGVSGGLAMPDAATAYTNLVGTPAGQAPLDRVSAGDSEASYLFHKVNGSHLDVGGSGGKMPQGGMLEPAQVTTIADWIDQGALP